MIKGYKEKVKIHDGHGFIYKFDNGQNICKHSGSYGNDKGLYEIAVLDSRVIYVTLHLLLMM